MEGVTLTEVALDVEHSAVEIKGLRVDDQEIYDALAALDEEKRIDYVVRALRVGCVVLQVMDTTSRVDYVRSEFESMQREMGSELERVFSEKGALVKAMDGYLGEKGELRRALDAHFGPQGSVIYGILNPEDESTPLGRFRRQLQAELDADREGTAFQKLSKAMSEGFEKVLVALGAAEGAAAERERGTAKGADFEDEVYGLIDGMARAYDDAVESVGDESEPTGKVGDVVIRLNTRDTGGVERCIVVEAKNRKLTLTGKGSFLKELDGAMKNRGADYAIGAVQESMMPKQWGCLRFFDGAKIVCSVSGDAAPLPLEIAYKVARCELVAQARRGGGEIDVSLLEAKVSEIQRQLDSLGAVTRALSGAGNQIDGAKADLKKMECSIREALDEVLGLILPENDEGEA